MTRRTIRFAIGLTLSAIVIGPCGDLIDRDRVTHTTCTEDMPCWNCHTMGNHVCGPNQNNR